MRTNNVLTHWVPKRLEIRGRRNVSTYSTEVMKYLISFPLNSIPDYERSLYKIPPYFF